MGEKKISMIDIARLSGVSIATVSRVLNRNGRYSEETEKRVMDIVNQYGYKVNQNAKSLRTSKSQSIGVIVPDITNEFFAKIVRSIETYIIPQGYTVFVCDSNENPEMEDIHIQSLLTKNVDGIIYISVKDNVNEIFDVKQIPVIYIDRRPENAGILVTSDNEFGGFYAGEELIRQGCTRIVMLRDEKGFSTVRQRYNGFKRAHEKYHVPLHEELILDLKVDYNASNEKIRALIQSGVNFDGIFANNDIMAVGALHALKDAQIAVPDQVKVVGFDGIWLTEICSPPMTTVRQNTDEFGKRSVELLLKLMRGKHAKKEDFKIPVEMIKRRTT